LQASIRIHGIHIHNFIMVVVNQVGNKISATIKLSKNVRIPESTIDSWLKSAFHVSPELYGVSKLNMSLRILTDENHIVWFKTDSV